MGIRRNFRPTNLVTNGNFVDGGSWTPVGGVESVADNTYTLTGDSPSGGGVATIQSTSTAVVVAHKYYVKTKMRVTNTVCQSIYTQIDGSTAGTNIVVARLNTPVQNVWYSISGVATAGADFTGNFKVVIQQEYADAATANGKVMEVQQVIVIDLTALFGAGNEPTQAWCDLNIPNWFDGTMSGGRRIGGIR